MNTPTVDIETLRRLDKPGPRYTSYPTALSFHEGFGEAEYREHLRALDADPTASLSVYVHLPFCEVRCSFCACHVIATQHPGVAPTYLDHLAREIELVASQLPNRPPVLQVHWGGGTPTYMAPEQLATLYGQLRSAFAIQPDAEVAIEVDPRVTSRAHLETLASLGFNRLSLGVQDFDPEVQDLIGRHQTWEQTETLVRIAREIGFDQGLNMDLIYGLPGQTEQTFAEGLDRVLTLRPSRLAIYSFAYVPWMKSNQKRLDEDALPDADTKLRLYLAALERLTGAGYEAIGMDHFALPEDSLARAANAGRLFRNFMGYTVQPATASIGLGVSAIGDVAGAFVQNEKKLSRYYEALEAGKLPVERGYARDRDDEIRRAVILDAMCNFAIDRNRIESRFDIAFGDYFGPDLASLEELRESGLVEDDGRVLRMTPLGRLFVRNAAMVFDRHLRERQSSKPAFSRTV